MSVAVVLDVSAIRAFVGGSLAVGEMLMMLGEEAKVAALPAVAMAEVFGDAEHVGMGRYLIEHQRTEIVPLDASDVEQVGRLSGLPSLSYAHAAVTARRLATFLMTEEPDRFTGVVDKKMIIEI